MLLQECLIQRRLMTARQAVNRQLLNHRLLLPTFLSMLLLVPIFICLFTSWMLWGWCVGESKNIKWLRQWCAPTFVVMSGLICLGIGAGAGGFVARLMVQRDVEEFLKNIEQQIHAGKAEDIALEIRSANPKGNPDIGTFPILDLLPELNERLANGRDANPAANVAETETPPVH